MIQSQGLTVQGLKSRNLGLGRRVSNVGFEFLHFTFQVLGFVCVVFIKVQGLRVEDLRIQISGLETLL